ncbi:TetR/AcrR family transcriptional regulator [Deinococcus hopiensis]|uniref:Transcriptional regulator, TetR family n=1 Tax=Deinococcus hopiensis KR-140 TaxID=695939 RepID=A0A1W1UCF3_9DEIO|nr:TetR/AcrR family transcriptional regulator [Deinococcus hopiensis]SMB78491.1 transcriptional regulator, TetR family [Deinococcus hopiensis KR-140]
MHSQDEVAFRLAWGLSHVPTRGPKPQYTIDDIAQAGVAVADASGLEGLSLANVAKAVGLTTTALYRYVSSKDTLIELIADAAAGPAPELTGATWQERVSAWAAARAAQIRLHPWLANVHPTSMPRLPHAIAWIDALLSAVADEPTIHGLRLALLVDTVVTTYTRNALSTMTATALPDWLNEAIASGHPHLGHAMTVQTDEDELRAAIAIILRGISPQAPI